MQWGVSQTWPSKGMMYTYMCAERLLATTMFIMRCNPLWSLYDTSCASKKHAAGPKFWMQITADDAQQREPFWHCGDYDHQLSLCHAFVCDLMRARGRNRLQLLLCGRINAQPDYSLCSGTRHACMWWQREKFHLFAAGVLRLWFAYGKNGCICAAFNLGRGNIHCPFDSFRE
jgi:hypothetical protein